ncbi:MAG: hypothetical protein ACM3NS_03440 [Deltaproteobacteria bacterium]
MRSRAALTLLVAAMGSAPPVAAQSLYYEGALSVASGAYIFPERTTGWSLFTGLAAEAQQLTFRITLPVYLQNSTLIALSGPGGSIPTGGSFAGIVADTGAARGRRGSAITGRAAAPALAQGKVAVPSSAVTGYRAAVGDPVGELSVRAVNTHNTALSVSVLAKAPVADTATFGTGQWDVAAGIGVSQRIGARMTAGVDVKYWHLGDLPDLDFRDPVYGTATIGYLGERGWGGGATFSAGSSALEGYDGPAWIGGYLSRSSAAGTWGLHGAVGLTETTPDFTLGLSWSVRLAQGR